MPESVEPNILRGDDRINPIVVESCAVRAGGTFALRRTHYLNEIEQGLTFSVEQRQALAKLIKGGDIDAKQKVIANNLRLVAGIAMSYVNRGVEFLDLISEGTMGLIQALDKFELEGSLRFQVYARWCIRENIERAIMTQKNCQLTGTC